MRGGLVLWCVVVTPCLCGAQVGDGGSLIDRYAPVAVSGLSSGVVMVAAGVVRARVVCCGYLWVLWDVGACLRCALAAFECSGVGWTGCDVEE